MKVEHNFLADDVLLFHFMKSEHMSLAADACFLSKYCYVWADVC
jgi:hypothetical protein